MKPLEVLRSSVCSERSRRCPFRNAPRRPPGHAFSSFEKETDASWETAPVSLFRLGLPVGSIFLPRLAPLDRAMVSFTAPGLNLWWKLLEKRDLRSGRLGCSPPSQWRLSGGSGRPRHPDGASR